MFKKISCLQTPLSCGCRSEVLTGPNRSQPFCKPPETKHQLVGSEGSFRSLPTSPRRKVMNVSIAFQHISSLWMSIWKILNRGVHYIINPKRCTVQRKFPTKTVVFILKINPWIRRRVPGVTSQLSQILHNNLDMIIIRIFNLFQSSGRPISVSPRYHLPTKCCIQHHLGRHITGMDACRHLNNNLPALEISSAWVSTSWAIGKTATETWNAKAQSYPFWELAISFYKYPVCIVQIPIKPRLSFFLVVQTRPHFRKNIHLKTPTQARSTGHLITFSVLGI